MFRCVHKSLEADGCQLVAMETDVAHVRTRRTHARTPRSVRVHVHLMHCTVHLLFINQLLIALLKADMKQKIKSVLLVVYFRHNIKAFVDYQIFIVLIFVFGRHFYNYLLNTPICCLFVIFANEFCPHQFS